MKKVLMRKILAKKIKNTSITYIANIKTNKLFCCKLFVCLKMANNYYQKHKEKLQKEART